MTDNLTLWHAVEKTPPSQTKEITGKSYKGNSPKPHYLIWKATETFGPCGIGWGFTVEDERIEEGADGARMHIARVKVWYKWNGERGEVEHVGGTAFSGKRSNGNPFTDEDAPKKSITDALIKALSMIGFAGDIFMGRYDDNKYLAELRAEEKQNAAPPPSKPDVAEAYREKTPEDTKDYAMQWLENSGRNLDTLKAAWGYIHSKYQKAPFYSDLVERKDEIKAQLTKEAA